MADVTILLGLLSNFWPYILAGLGGLVFIFQQRRAGAKAERARQAQRDAEARDVADQVDNDVGAMTPEQRKEALKKWSRS